MSYFPLMLQQFDPETETWKDCKLLHAVKVNRASGRETFDADAEQYHLALVFRFAWTHLIERVRFDPQHWQLVYEGRSFNIVGFDDYMEQHRFADITGVCYG